MRKILLLLPLLLLGCGSESNIDSMWEYQPLVLGPPPQDPNPLEPVVLDIDQYVPRPAITSDEGWTARLKGLPVSLNDVAWSGEHFIAVGDNGVILISPDGIDWAQVISETNARLNSVTTDGFDVVAVGQNGTVLVSTDHGQNWTVRHYEDNIELHAVVVNSWQIIAGGRVRQTAAAFMMRSEDRGATWTVVEPLPQSGHWSTDMVYAGGLFVATTDIPRSTGGTRVWVSVDGKEWNDIVLMDAPTAGLYSILHDGNQFIVAGDYGAAFTSPGGTYWTRSETPSGEISYLSGAWSGSELKLAGGITWWYWWIGEPRFGVLDVGLTTQDGGLTWNTFNIDGYFECSGMAWGNGRFVAVGTASELLDKGAVYTSG